MPPLGHPRGFRFLGRKRHPLVQITSRTCAGATYRLVWRPHRGRSLRGHQTGTLGALSWTTASSPPPSSLSRTQRSPSP